MLVWDSVFTCVLAEPAHVLELAILVHSSRISQRHLVELCCKLFLQTCWVWSILSPIGSESQADMMVGTFQHLHFVPSLHHLCAISPWAAFLVILVQDHHQKWSYHGSHPFPMISKIIHRVVFDKVVHIIHSSPIMSFFELLQMIIWELS